MKSINTESVCFVSAGSEDNNEKGTAETTVMKTSPKTNQDQIQPEEDVDRETYNLQGQSSVKKRPFPIS